MINLNSLTKNIKDGFKAPTGDSNRETPTKGALRFNTETGKRFLNNILEMGGSEEPMELFKRFRGREPQIDAMLRHAGISA